MATLTLEQQSDFVRDLAGRCIMLDGNTAGTTHLSMTADDVEKLQRIADRLLRMAPFQGKIERMVTGK